jgi:hypothetical protein
LATLCLGDGFEAPPRLRRDQDAVGIAVACEPPFARVRVVDRHGAEPMIGARRCAAAAWIVAGDRDAAFSTVRDLARARTRRGRWLGECT